MHITLSAFVALTAVWLAAVSPTGDQAAAQPSVVVWRIDNLSSIAGHTVTIVGAPRVVETTAGRAVAFDGRDDGLLLDVNPLAGLRRFTIEVVFQPEADGPEEQRMLHVQESASESRALVELRALPGASWCLDTFLRHGATGLTLIDRGAAHPVERWHAAALTYDGRTMTHFVDGRKEASGEIAFGPLGAGRTSVGVRQNLVSWFKGKVRLIRISPEAIPPAALLGAGPLPDRMTFM